MGAYCASTTPTVTRSSSGATVVLTLNTSTYRDVRRTDGVVIRQEVRGCRTVSCFYGPNNASNPDATLIATCQQLNATA